MEGARGGGAIRLGGAGRVLVVESGSASVFTVDAARPGGRRRPLYAIEAGDVLVDAGVVLVDAGVVLVDAGDSAAASLGVGERARILVPSPGALISEYSLQDFARGVAQSGAAAAAQMGPDEAERLLRRWIRAESVAAGAGRAMPAGSTPLKGPGSARIKGAGAVHPAYKTLWIKAARGEARFFGRGDFPALSPGLLFPLVRGAWVEAGDGALIEHAEAWPEGEELESSLGRFSALMLACDGANAAREAALDAARTYGRERADAGLYESAARRAGALFSRGARASAAAAAAAAVAAGDSPLMAACRVVAAAQGIRTLARPAGGRASGNAGGAEDAPEGVDAICGASGIRSRPVRLEGAWWKESNGPLLVFEKEGGAPLAALPARRGRYTLLDPASGRHVALGAAAAAGLSAAARVFYKPLPKRPLRLADLALHGLSASGRDLALMLAIGAVGAVLSLLAPALTAYLIDAVIPEAGRTELLQLAVLLGAASLSVFAFDACKALARLRAETRVEAAVNVAIWDRLLALPATFFRGFSAGDLAARSASAEEMIRGLSGIAASAATGLLFACANLALMFSLAPGLAWLALALGLAGIAAAAGAALALAGPERRAAELDGKTMGIALQLISGVAKIRATGAEAGAFSHWAAAFHGKMDAEIGAGRVRAAWAAFTEAFPALALAAIFALAGPVAGADAGLSAGAFMAFLAAFMAMEAALTGMGFALVESLSAVPSCERLRPLIAATPEERPGLAQPGTLSGRIEASGLCFGYGSDLPPVLDGCSFDLMPGEFLAVVGPSGSGKSTLLRLLLGFERPLAGAVYYDGQDLATLDPRAVRGQIGVVLQNGGIMAGDMKTAILGSSSGREEDAWEAAALAQIADDIEEMPMGMHTMIPAGAATLSGGQRQRLLIARALARKPRILFLDEATSALDNKTQAGISKSLEAMQCARIVIAHRLSTVARADRIVVLDGGRVAEQGGYEELLAAGGRFAELARRQIV